MDQQGGLDGVDDDDEEMLQLKLQAIEARLKLKKLQNARAQQKTADVFTESDLSRPDSAPTGIPLQSRLAAARERQDRPQSQNAVQVPASPVKRSQSAAALPCSPARVLLGIDKGRKANDVSLKRASSLRKLQEDNNGQQGGYLRRTKTPLPNQVQPAEPEQPKSFSERLLSAKSEDAAKRERQERIEKLRSAAFDVNRQEIEDYKSKAVDLPDLPDAAPAYSREEILASVGKTAGGLRRSNTAPSIRGASRAAQTDSGVNTPPPDLSANPGASKKKVPPGEVPESEATSFDPYSTMHLSKRFMPHATLARIISGKKTYVLKDLLRHVKAPDWSLPDIEQDIVLFAIIASKSDPRNHRPGTDADGNAKAAPDRGKYMVLTLVDLTWEVELYLFNGGFDRFWKLTPGTVIAILNPTIIPPPPGRAATGRFGLVINSDADTILEVGVGRDLGYCRSVRRDGQPCRAWVNARRTEHCEFHTNEAVRRAKSSRLELNGMDFGGAIGGRVKFNSHAIRDTEREDRKREREKTVGRAANSGLYDRASQTHVFVSKAAQRDDERERAAADRAERAEALKRRLAHRERERDLARQLGEIGAGAGKEYMRRGATATLGSSVSSSGTTSTAVSGAAASSSTSVSGGDAQGQPQSARVVDARALGLVVPRGQEPKISLSPVKRKRPASSLSASTTTSAGGGKSGGAALGWGSTLGDKLTRMKGGERLDGTKAAQEADAARDAAPGPDPGGRGGSDRSPVRKKTRFVTEKGIREAGRESLGEQLSASARRRQMLLDENDDDDDDLIILK